MIKNGFWVILFVSMIFTSLAWGDPPDVSSFESCLAQLPKGPYHIDPDGKKIHFSTTYDSESTIQNSNADTGVVKYTLNSTPNISYEADFNKNSSGKVVTVQIAKKKNFAGNKNVVPI